MKRVLFFLLIGVILPDDEENQRKAYSLLVGTFQKNNRESP